MLNSMCGLSSRRAMHTSCSASGENRTLMSGLENPRNEPLYDTRMGCQRAREFILCARRRFSVSAPFTITNSGAVLCAQSMNPTKVVAREQPTQVVVWGRASRRAGGIVFPQVSQQRITTPPQTYGSSRCGTLAALHRHAAHGVLHGCAC